MNPTYKHLESRLKIGELTIGQWMSVFCGVMVMFLWGSYVSPFGTGLTIISSVYIGGLPVTAVLVASYAEFNVFSMLRAASRWHRTTSSYLPGAGQSAKGYVISPDLRAEREAARAATQNLDLDTLWDS